MCYLKCHINGSTLGATLSDFIVRDRSKSTVHLMGEFN